ncbi:hypothetical protein [Spiroplasma endosymbiont of Dromius quadrimaculatus]|uniref:hypothetical protein n=1 Tax=Spiroplasma endosymbiont of Dromius quadrimaculatus TaxID=3066283 RepID=UPI00313E938C
MFLNMILATTTINKNMGIALTVSCLILTILCFVIHWLLVTKYFSKVVYKDTLWFFIKKNIFFLCGCMFTLGFIASLISILRIFS